jgi:integrase
MPAPKRKKIGRPKKRRTRTQHPGVKIKQITRTGTWVARWVDPESGKEVQRSFNELGKTTEQARRAWAIDKSKQIRGIRADLEAGKTIQTRTGLDKAVKAYLEGLSRKRRKTVEIYGVALGHLTAWARKAHVSNIEELTGKHLSDLKKYLHNLKAKRNATGKGIGRKAKKKSARLLAPASVNQFVRGIRTFLRHCRKDDLTPNLTSDMIRDRLEFAERESNGDVRFLKAHEITALVEACQRHDTATYTRHRWQEGRHYQQITPFVVALLLGGFRFSEAASLRWADCDLQAGVITIRASATKTRTSRTVTLKESPALWALLERMKLQAGDTGFVFGDAAEFARAKAEPCRKRLIRAFAAPAFTWHDLRRTAATYSINMPDANLKRTSKRLGHSIAIADKLYWDAVEVPADATTIEAAMGIADLLETRAQTLLSANAKAQTA